MANEPQYTKAEATKAAKQATAEAKAALADDADIAGNTRRITPQEQAMGARVLQAAYGPTSKAPKPAQASYATPTTAELSEAALTTLIERVTTRIVGGDLGHQSEFNKRLETGRFSQHQYDTFLAAGDLITKQIAKDGLYSPIGAAFQTGKQDPGGYLDLNNNNRIDKLESAAYAVAFEYKRTFNTGMDHSAIAEEMKDQEFQGLVKQAYKALQRGPAFELDLDAINAPKATLAAAKDKPGMPVSLLPEGFDKPVKALAARPAVATDSVTRSLEAVFSADSRMAEFQKQFQLNAKLSAKFGVDAGGFGRADVDGNGNLDKKDFYALLAPAVEMLKQGHSVADIAKQIGSPNYMEQAAQELSRTTGTRIATVGSDGYNHGGKTGGPSR